MTEKAKAIPETQYAVQLVGPSELRLNTAKPVIRPGPTQVLARIEAVGLCFSDLKLLKQFAGHARKGEILSGIDPAARIGEIARRGFRLVALLGEAGLGRRELPRGIADPVLQLLDLGPHRDQFHLAAVGRHRAIVERGVDLRASLREDLLEATEWIEVVQRRCVVGGQYLRQQWKQMRERVAANEYLPADSFSARYTSNSDQEQAQDHTDVP